MRSRAPMIFAAASMALIAAARALDDEIVIEARPRRRQVERNPDADFPALRPDPEPRQKTAHDLARIEAAERKRDRKAAKLRDTADRQTQIPGGHTK